MRSEGCPVFLKEISMEGSNEKDWKKYQLREDFKEWQKEHGVNPEESFNFTRGFLFVFAVFLVIVLAFWVIG